MPIIFYRIPVCGPCRAVLMTADHLGIELDVKDVDSFSGYHMKPEYMELCAYHCAPTIDDDGFILWESRAIQAYLVNKYAPDSPLYPRDPKKRAVVDRMLHFDLGTLFPSLRDFLNPILFKGLPVDPEKEERMNKSLAIFEKILEKTTYAAGNHLTLADFSILSNLVIPEEMIDHNYADFPRINAWLQRMKEETPKYHEINVIPLKELKKQLKSKK